MYEGHAVETSLKAYKGDRTQRRKLFIDLLASIRLCRTETYTLWEHSTAVAAMAMRLSAAMRLSQELCDLIYLGGLLHDVGKTSSCALTLFKPGPLTPTERLHIQLHPVTGAEMVKPLDLQVVSEAVHCHHELFDGTGYPFGLSGREIPLPARIVAVADYYEALRECRPYRPTACTHAEAIAILARLARQEKLDPTVVRTLVNVTSRNKSVDNSKIFQKNGHIFDKIF